MTDGGVNNDANSRLETYEQDAKLARPAEEVLAELRQRFTRQP